MTRLQLSEHFTIEEFDCNDGTRVPKEYEPALRRLCNWYLEPMRKKFGPCTVHSGFRHTEYNRRIGGARLSFHDYLLRKPKDGVAADVSFKNGNPSQWHSRAKRLRFWRRKGKGGLGYYPQGGFIHIDTRDYAADWNGS